VCFKLTGGSQWPLNYPNGKNNRQLEKVISIPPYDEHFALLFNMPLWRAAAISRSTFPALLCPRNVNVERRCTFKINL